MKNLEPRKRSWLGPTIVILVLITVLWVTQVVGYMQGYARGYQAALTACESLRGVEKEGTWNFKRQPISAWKKMKNYIDGSPNQICEKNNE